MQGICNHQGSNLQDFPSEEGLRYVETEVSDHYLHYMEPNLIIHVNAR